MINVFKKRKLNKENGGYSLLELVVVIAIMFAFTGLVAISAQSIMSANVSRVARSLGQAMAHTQALAMAKPYAYLAITNDGETYNIKIVTPDGIEDNQEIGVSKNDKVVLEYDGTKLSAGNTVVLSYTASGQLKRASAYSYTDATGTYTGTLIYPSEFTASNASRAAMVKIYKSTGKYEIIK